ncbi:hypothetical protein GCM10009802_02860 [Streptomyces synnematoformans]|uniref:site-specific DNA-methyltransferase (adenine-specific) n=1 Tax=Streptomyces synnematoformans TaxID=415721 RepID=A0ABN2XC62_9ACTN
MYTTVLIAWAEDHGLIRARLRAGAEAARKEHQRGGGTVADWIRRGLADLAAHPATACLADPRFNPMLAATPPDGPLDDLVAWWSADAPGLRYDVDDGPESITGLLPGELLQYITDERKRHALAQTPWWLADLLVDRTLIPAAREHRDETLLTCDPTCGTGHMLIALATELWELYTTGRLPDRPGRPPGGVTGWTPVSAGEAVKRIRAGVDGCELDPLTAAVARLRMTVYLGELLRRGGALPGPLTIARIPRGLVPRIVVGDSLLARKVSASEYAQLRPEQAAIVNLGMPDEPVSATGPEQLALPTGGAS